MIDHETHQLLARERVETALQRSARRMEAVPRTRRPQRVRRRLGAVLIATGRRLASESTGAGARASAPDAVSRPAWR